MIGITTASPSPGDGGVARISTQRSGVTWQLTRLELVGSWILQEGPLRIVINGVVTQHKWVTFFFEIPISGVMSPYL